jgi:hypothetical protein
MIRSGNAGITGDDIQKTKDYADALTKLQNSLNGVNSILPEFSEGIDSGLKAIASKHKASAQLALQDAAKKAYEAEQIRLKSDDDTLTTWDKFVDFWNRAPIETEGSAALNV